MDINFEKEYLKELYEGVVKDKEYKSQPTLVKQYVKTVNMLKSVKRIEQLYQLKSLHYEKKQGNLKGKSAVYINHKYRLIFAEIASEDPPFEINLLSLEDISKHYE